MRTLRHQLLRFGGASVVTFATSVGVPVALHEGLGADPRMAVAIGLVTAFLLSFALQRLFVFRSTGSPRREATLFLMFSLGWRVLEYLAFLALFAAEMPYEIALITVLGVSAVFKFAVCRTVIFTPSDPDGGGE